MLSDIELRSKHRCHRFNLRAEATRLEKRPLSVGGAKVGLFLGFDPGGVRAFGWSALSGNQLPLQLIARGVANHAEGAVQAALAAIVQNSVTASGIDAPMYWQPRGDRNVDQLVRTNIVQRGSSGGTVNAVNSMRGACLIQGMMVAMLLRANIDQLPITESHPKALLWLLGIAQPGNPPAGIALGNLQQWIVGNVAGASDHERDAALGALSAFAMTSAMVGWRDLYQQEVNPITPLNPPPGYWLPI